MNVSLAFTRIFFGILSVLFMTVFAMAQLDGSYFVKASYGIGFGLVIIALLIGFDILFRKFNLRSFNIAIVGLFIGYLMGIALDLLFSMIIDISSISTTVHDDTIDIIRILLFLFGTYLGTIFTLRSSDELYVSIPFIQFAPSEEKQKDFLIDGSVLSDARILDLCATGVLDKAVVVPRFVIKDLYAHIEIGNENTKLKSRRCLDTLKKMEELPGLKLRYNDTDFPEVKDIHSKLIRLARLVDANLLSADISKVEMSSIEGIKIINIHSLSNALKPLQDTGEYITIKVQRVGKEPRQGVGYLEDGTMVVINGGGHFIGQTIDAQVLSVKHTSSGRMIFCNALEEGQHNEPE